MKGLRSLTPSPFLHVARIKGLRDDTSGGKVAHSLLTLQGTIMGIKSNI